MESYFETLTDEELARDRAQLTILMQTLEQTHLLAKRIHPGSILGGPALSEARMLFELAGLATNLREEKKRKAEQVMELQNSNHKC